MGLPSGYNRDFQLTKKPLIKGFQITSDSLRIMAKLVAALGVDPERCRQALSSDVFAADAANRYVMQGMPFRDAYRKIKEELPALCADDIEKAVAAKTHTGAPGNPGLDCARARLDSVAARLIRIEGPLRAALSALQTK